MRARVVAPVPWFPSPADTFGKYATFARVPHEETRFGIPITHPKYLVIPKVGMNAAPFLLYLAARPAIERILRSGYDFDLIDAHHFYPGGVAAVMLGRHFDKPVTVTARGTDVNLAPRYAVPRRMIRWTAANAAGAITVCRALKDALVEIGVEADKVRVFRNGVDLERFRPLDRATARRTLDLQPPVVASVGDLISRKGHHLVIQALAKLPDAHLVIAGDGPEAPALKRLAKGLEMEGRVRFLGAVANERLREVYSAADVLVLASDREGWPNVLLEAMACGTPVAATDVWGNAEVVAAPAAGRLIPRRDPDAIADTVRALLADPPERADTRAYAEQFDWDETTQDQLNLFREILSRRSATRGQVAKPA
ncbi:MAG: glycosyltransferase family 4 protein [Kiloniellaceae bacterium]